MEQALFKRGDRVVDRGGYEGTVVGVTHHNGSVWYDVRLPGGVGVRFPYELEALKEASR
jgi:preprotein translocase subunit YajC